MRYLIIILSLLMALPVITTAQQLPLFTSYRENGFILNPAIAGSKASPVASLSARTQWLKMKEAPHTETLSCEGPVGTSRLGLGGYMINDETGPTAFTGVGLSYAYHISFKKIKPFHWARFLRKSKMSFGLNTSLFYYRLQRSELVLEEENDRAVIEENKGRLMPNAGAGFYYYYQRFYLGFSVPQMLELETRFKGLQGTSSLKRVNHYYVLAGGRVPLGEYGKVVFEPMAWFRAVKGAPWQLDVNGRFIFNNVVWVGAGYRTKSFIFGDMGVIVKKQWKLGYAVDFTVSNISEYLGTTHEIILKYRFQPEKNYTIPGNRRW